MISSLSYTSYRRPEKSSLLSGASAEGPGVELGTKAWQEGGLSKGTTCTRTGRGGRTGQSYPVGEQVKS